MVWEWDIPSKWHNADQRDDVNWAPRSEVIVLGRPKREIQPWKRAAAQSAAEVEDRGMASGYLVILSMMVKRCVNPPDGGKGLSRSTWMWEKRRAGTGMGAAFSCMWR